MLECEGSANWSERRATFLNRIIRANNSGSFHFAGVILHLSSHGLIWQAPLRLVNELIVTVAAPRLSTQ